jgi:uncharacterized protein (UPF0276 family)
MQIECTLGPGIGWRPELAAAIQRRAEAGRLGFVEIIAEDFDPAGPVPAPLRRLADLGVRIVPHGVTLSLGGAEPPDPARLSRLARLAEKFAAPLVSEHVCFVRGGGLESGHLLPLPRDRATLEIAAANIRAASAALPVPLAVENIASLLEWPAPEMDAPAFLSELLSTTGAGLLLDLENVYADSLNFGFDPVAFVERLPLDRLSYVHVSGGVKRADGLYHDTHVHPTPPAVLRLVEELAARCDVPGVLLERDGRFPPEAELNAELDAIAEAETRGRTRRSGREATRELEPP